MITLSADLSVSGAILANVCLAATTTTMPQHQQCTSRALPTCIFSSPHPALIPTPLNSTGDNPISRDTPSIPRDVHERSLPCLPCLFFPIQYAQHMHLHHQVAAPISPAAACLLTANLPVNCLPAVKNAPPPRMPHAFATQSAPNRTTRYSPPRHSAILKPSRNLPYL